VRVSNANAAKRYVITGIFDGKLAPSELLEWTNEPPVLAMMMPPPVHAGGVAKASFDATSKLDWAELRKFAPANYVENLERQLNEARQRGMDIRSLIRR